MKPDQKVTTAGKLVPDAIDLSDEGIELDPVIHERTRLTILTSLVTHADRACSYLDLRETLHLTDGNLMTHLRVLENAGHIYRTKRGHGRSGITTIHLSASGCEAFDRYLDRLEKLVRAARGNR